MDIQWKWVSVAIPLLFWNISVLCLHSSVAAKGETLLPANWTWYCQCDCVLRHQCTQCVCVCVCLIWSYNNRSYRSWILLPFLPRAFQTSHSFVGYWPSQNVLSELRPRRSQGEACETRQWRGGIEDDQGFESHKAAGCRHQLSVAPKYTLHFQSYFSKVCDFCFSCSFDASFALLSYMCNSCL